MKLVKRLVFWAMFGFLLIEMVFFRKTVNAVDLCCPPEYGDRAVDCPSGVDRTRQCCKRYDFTQYNIVDKYPCGEEPPPTSQCPPGYGDTALDCPAGVDLTKSCCRRNGFADYDIVSKISNSINPNGVFCNINDLSNLRVNTALGCVPVEIDKFVVWLLPYLFGIAGGIAFLLMIFGFIKMSTAGGDPKAVQGAKETISSALTGLLVCVFALFILRLIAVDILHIPGIN